jgi:hypothetical protein
MSERLKSESPSGPRRIGFAVERATQPVEEPSPAQQRKAGGD